jgi:Flp pilus assembly protein TadG
MLMVDICRDELSGLFPRSTRWRQGDAQMRATKNREQSRGRRSGATTVEMAIVTPFFFFLVFGLVEFARMVMVQQALTNAAREGTRVAALATTTNQLDVDTAVRNFLSSSVTNATSSSIVTVTTNPASFGSLTSGTSITTTVSVNYSDVSWMPATFLGSSVLKGQATMVRE